MSSRGSPRKHGMNGFQSYGPRLQGEMHECQASLALTQKLAIMGVHPVLDTNTSEVLTKRFPRVVILFMLGFAICLVSSVGFFYT